MGSNPQLEGALLRLLPAPSGRENRYAATGVIVIPHLWYRHLRLELL